MKLSAWSITDIGRTRKSNQDSIGSFPDLNLFVVADGMGGHADGDVASHMAVDLLHGFFEDAGGMPVCPSDVDCLKQAVEQANQQIYKVGQQSAVQHVRTLGTTVVVLKVDVSARQAAWVHVGDSRLYRLRNGELALLTADHTLFGNEYLNKGPIPTDLPHTNQLVQALGTSEHVDVSTATDAVLAGDLFLLCSDGISGQLSAAAIAAVLTDTPSLETAGRTLIQLSLDAGGRDNASVVLVRASEE